MDYLGGAAASLIHTPAAAAASSGFALERVIGLIVALAVLRLEVMRRTADANNPGNAWHMKACTRFLWQHAPEATGLAACLSLAVALRLHGQADVPHQEQATWEKIMREWPILMTADSLLALQAMLRVLVYLSVILRAAPHPLNKEVALIFCGAAVGRALLSAKSGDYFLDGPLGGFVPVICEVASVLLLACLSRGICKRGMLNCMFSLAIAAYIARRNCLSLANDAFIDGLFIFAHVTELIAAFAYLWRSLILDVRAIGMGRGSVAWRFAHTIMLVQQCLAAYYFIHAFEENDGLVGAGHPFQILQLGGVAQLAAFASASMLLLAEHLEAVDDVPAQ